MYTCVSLFCTDSSLGCRQSMTSFNHFNGDGGGHCVTEVTDGHMMQHQPQQPHRASVIVSDSASFHFQPHRPPPPGGGGGVGLTLDVGRLPPPVPQLPQQQQQQLVTCRRHQQSAAADAEGCSTPSSDITPYTNVSFPSLF